MKKRFAVIICLMLFLAVLAGCAKYSFIGKWTEEGTGNSVEFKNDGTMIYSTAAGAGVTCSFTAAKETDYFDLTVPVPGGENQTYRFTYTIVEKTLTLTSDSGVTSKYTKQ